MRETQRCTICGSGDTLNPQFLSLLVCAALSLPGVTPVDAVTLQPIAYRVSAKLPDALQQLSPGDIELHGWLGNRVLVNEKNRLLKVDLEPLLAGFQHKPGTHPWIGEHLGKWMHAATLAWAYTGDAALRRKLDYAAAELVKAQEADGYLGTYLPSQRFGLYRGADWYAVTLHQPATVRRIVFIHGRNFHDGGWFDASKGKPRIDVRHAMKGAWETVAQLTDYPATTATETAGLRDSQVFTQELAAPVRVTAIRIVGAPACGDDPTQAFSSCAELQAIE
jgi:hypothetical protein